MKRFWADYSTHDFARLPRAHLVAVQPIAAIVQHGPHLPLSTDLAILDGLVAATIPRLPEDLPVVFLPTQPVGAAPEHARYPGTLTAPASALIALWTAIGASVAAAGVKKLVFLNAHAGQAAVADIVARDLRIAHDMVVVAADWLGFGLPDGLLPESERRHGIHAGAIETAMMLALHPELVEMRLARVFELLSERLERNFRHLGIGAGGRLAWQAQDLNPAGAVGRAAEATAETGQRILEHVADRLVELLEDVHRLPVSLLHNPTEL